MLLDGNGRVKLSYFGIWEEVDHSVDPVAVEQFYCAPGKHIKSSVIVLFHCSR